MNQIHQKHPRPWPAWCGIRVLLTLSAGLTSLNVAAQEPRRSLVDVEPAKHASAVNDTAGLFDRDAVSAARKALAQIEHETKVATVIQTVESLRNKKIADVAVRAARESGIQGAATSSNDDSASPLVLRNQVRLGLAGARAIIAGARARAMEMKLNVNIATVDDGGHLVAFERMDGARPASLYTAITKATSAATFRQPTGPVPAGTNPGDPVLNLSLQNAAQMSGGKITALLGGVPVVVDGQIIGAVGIAGGTGEQDAQVARAGVQAFTDQLNRTEQAAKAAKTPEKPE